jgi:maltose O-acetyltransferase
MRDAILRLIFAMTPLTRLYRFRAHILRLRRFNVAASVLCVSSVRIYAPNVSIGPNSFIGHEARIYGGTDSKIFIGAGVSIAPHVLLVAGTHHIGPSSRRAGRGYGTEIVIGDGAWLGTASVIIGPCVIGPGAVIAAGATVRENIPGNTLSYGSDLRAPRDLV